MKSKLTKTIIKDLIIAIISGYCLSYVFACPQYAYYFTSQFISLNIKDWVKNIIDLCAMHIFTFLLFKYAIKFIKHLFSIKKLLRLINRNSVEKTFSISTSIKLDLLNSDISNYNFLNSYNTIRLTE